MAYVLLVWCEQVACMKSMVGDAGAGSWRVGTHVLESRQTLSPWWAGAPTEHPHFGQTLQSVGLGGWLFPSH